MVLPVHFVRVFPVGQHDRRTDELALAAVRSHVARVTHRNSRMKVQAVFRPKPDFKVDLKATTPATTSSQSLEFSQDDLFSEDKAIDHQRDLVLDKTANEKAFERFTRLRQLAAIQYKLDKHVNSVGVSLSMNEASTFQICTLSVVERSLGI
jgi:hypothetical protein